MSEIREPRSQASIINVAPRAPRWTLWRYVRHREDALQRVLQPVAALRTLVLSMQLKWDETQQPLTCFLDPKGDDEAPVGDAAAPIVVDAGAPVGDAASPVGDAAASVDDDDDEDEENGVAVQQVVSVMDAIAYIKTNNMPAPIPWVIFPAMLDRTTAENIWLALSMRSPLDISGMQLPAASIVKWIWILTVADQASSNRRFQAPGHGAWGMGEGGRAFGIGHRSGTIRS